MALARVLAAEYRSLMASNLKIPNPLDYVTGAALGRHLRGGVKWPANPVVKEQPPILLAAAQQDPKRKRRTVPDNARGH